MEWLALNQGVARVGDQLKNAPRLSDPAAGANEPCATQSQSQEAKPSWKDKVKSAVGIGDTPEQPPRAPAPAAGAAEAAQKRGQQRQGPQK